MLCKSIILACYFLNIQIISHYLIKMLVMFKSKIIFYLRNKIWKQYKLNICKKNCYDSFPLELTYKRGFTMK